MSESLQTILCCKFFIAINNFGIIINQLVTVQLAQILFILLSLQFKGNCLKSLKKISLEMKSLEYFNNNLWMPKKLFFLENHNSVEKCRSVSWGFLSTKTYQKLSIIQICGFQKLVVFPFLFRRFDAIYHLLCNEQLTAQSCLQWFWHFLSMLH